MKKLLLSLLLMAAATTRADAQGTIQFPRLRIDYCLGVEAPPAGALSFGIFVGPTADSLSGQPVQPLGTNTAGGFVSAPNASAYPLPGHEPNSTVFLQIRGWETRFGLDWQAGRNGGLYGETPILQVLLGPVTGPGTVIAPPLGLGEIVMCPEPSTIALALFGFSGVLLLRRRS